MRWSQLPKPDWIHKGIIVVPTQGFGNRIRMLADAWILSTLWNLPLSVIWTEDKDCHCQATDLFQQDPGLWTWKSMKDLSGLEYTYCGQIHTHEILYNALKDPSRFPPKDYLLLIGGHEFRHPNMCLSDFLVMKRYFYRNLKWSQRVEERMEAVRKLLPHKKGYIGVHYREYKPDGDGADANNPNSTIQWFNPARFSDNSPLSEYARMMSRLEVQLPIVWISNSSTAIQELRGMVSADVFSRIQVVPKSSFERTTVDGILDAVVDLRVLSESQLLIGSFFSSFSDEASCFNLIPKLCPMDSKLQKIIQSEKKNVSTVYHCFDCSDIPILGESWVGLHISVSTLSRWFRLL